MASIDIYHYTCYTIKTKLKQAESHIQKKEEKEVKILVFDDSPAHQKSAKALLKDHDLTVVGTYDEAERLLTVRIDEDAVAALVAEKFGAGFDPWKDGVSEEKKRAFYDFRGDARKKCVIHPDFDAVLTDLLVPASKKTLGDKGWKFVGQEMPLGTIIALRAMAAGVKLVAVVTDTNHHDHPASAALDHFPEVSAGGQKLLCLNSMVMKSVDAETYEPVPYEFANSEEGLKKYPRKPDYSQEGIVSVKAWDMVLAKLTA